MWSGGKEGGKEKRNRCGSAKCSLWGRKIDVWRRKKAADWRDGKERQITGRGDGKEEGRDDASGWKRRL